MLDVDTKRAAIDFIFHTLPMKGMFVSLLVMATELMTSGLGFMAQYAINNCEQPGTLFHNYVLKKCSPHFYSLLGTVYMMLFSLFLSLLLQVNELNYKNLMWNSKLAYDKSIKFIT